MDRVSALRADGSLFDGVAWWVDDPLAAFEAWLASPEYARTSRVSTAMTDNAATEARPVSPSSAKVYRAMFGVWLEHLRSPLCRDTGGQACAVPSVRPAQIESFVRGPLREASASTCQRYLRLLERLYEHLMHRGWVGANPVTLWTLQHAREVLRSRRRRARPVVRREQVADLARWLAARGATALDAGQWKDARDCTLALLSLTAGLRLTELVRLKRTQLREDGLPPGELELDIPAGATVKTAKAHRVFVAGACGVLLGRWLRARWSGHEGFGSIPGVLVFPATQRGLAVSGAAVFKNLGALAEDAVGEGVLDDDSRWVLASGAQGLRRAYVLGELGAHRDRDLLTERLGHWRRQSIRPYEADLARQHGLATAVGALL